MQIPFITRVFNSSPLTSRCKMASETPTPAFLSDIKMEPPEQLLDSDCSLTQAEHVDLSIHKNHKTSLCQSSSPPSSPMVLGTPLSAPPSVVSLLGLGSAVPAVLSPGSILASTQGSGGQQILHVIHTIHSVNLPSKMGNLQTIPVVVQSLPVMNTTLPTDGVTAALTVSILGSNGKGTGQSHNLLMRFTASEVENSDSRADQSPSDLGSMGLSAHSSVKADPESPVEINSDSDNSIVETSSSFSDTAHGTHLMRMQRGGAGSPVMMKR
ncbi:hypothetical protein XELAEV_18041941mg [Xenopus laevis]|nr:hypothetical protein XELAEV_18041941mg [Xenopus laevis]